MSLTCKVCELPGVHCICAVIESTDIALEELKVSLCNTNEYPHKGMAPVEIATPIDKAWRQVRDQANKDVATRKAITEHREVIEARADEIREEMAVAMTLGGLHPRTHDCMGN